MKRYHLFSLPFIFIILVSSAALAERLTVSASVANIRSGPGNHYEILRKVKKYYPVWILEKTGQWLRFCNYEGDEGWIHESLVNNVSTVITKTTNCNIRKGPGTFSKVSATVGKGLSFKIIKRKGEWLNIQHAGGFIGWIHESLVW